MAPRGPGSKAHAVRDYLKANPQAGNVEVARALAEKGIKVTAKYVSNIKHVMKTRRQVVKKVVTEKGVGIPEIKAALALLKVSGTGEAARAALAAAEEIKALI
jgi:hypothetical protein